MMSTHQPLSFVIIDFTHPHGIGREMAQLVCSMPP
jgi:hypothetical protein